MQFAFVVAIDSMAATALAYARFIEGAAAKERITLAHAFTAFAGLGLIGGHDHGLGWLFAIGFINGLVGVVAWFLVVKTVRRESDASQV